VGILFDMIIVLSYLIIRSVRGFDI
jgi:hypothetical protein